MSDEQIQKKLWTQQGPGCHPGAHETLKHSTDPGSHGKHSLLLTTHFCPGMDAPVLGGAEGQKCSTRDLSWLNSCDLSGKVEQRAEGRGARDQDLVRNMVTHINAQLSSRKDFVTVSKGRHGVVVEDRNVLLPGWEVTAGLNSWLQGRKGEEGNLEKCKCILDLEELCFQIPGSHYQRNTSGRRVDDFNNHQTAMSSWYTLWSQGYGHPTPDKPNTPLPCPFHTCQLPCQFTCSDRSYLPLTAVSAGLHTLVPLFKRIEKRRKRESYRKMMLREDSYFFVQGTGLETLLR